MVTHKKDAASAQTLIEERAQIGSWLEKLAAATDKPETVRAKVRAGYEKRLAEIATQLGGLRKEIEDSLKRQKTTVAELEQQEQEASERLAEAEVRHSVGELDEHAWKKVHAEVDGLLGKVREKLKTAQETVQRTSTALASLDPNATVAATKGKPADAVPIPDGPVPLQAKMSEFQHDPDPVVPTLPSAAKGKSDSLEAPPAAPPQTVRPSAPTMVPPRRSIATAPPRSSGSTPPPAPEPPPAAPAKQTDAFDELAFLKSVSEDDTHGPAQNRASGMARLSSSEPIIPDESVINAPPEPPAPKAPAAKAKAEKAKPAAGKPAGGGDGAGAKTLKCRECGAMNAPAEWYCERCGAELSAV